MNKFFYNNRKFLIAILSIFCAIFLFVLPFLSSEVALGEQTSPTTPQKVEPDNFAPNYDALVFDVTTPVDAIYFGNNIAVIKQDTISTPSRKTLWISKNGQAFTQYDLLLEGNPGQIKALDDNTIIVLDNTNLYKIDCNDLTAQPVPFKYGNVQINCQSFDLNQKYLVTNTNGLINLYEIENGQLKTIDTLGGTAENLTPICVNNEGTVFYIAKSTSKIYATNEKNQKLISLYTFNGEISQMIADNDRFFIIESGKVKLLNQDTPDQTSTELQAIVDQNNQLGNLTLPESLSFKGENLLISDSSINAIQEFSIADTTLTWTGFAVAKNKTAYNRFTNSIADVERTNDNLAVLTSDRITLINLKDFDYLNKDCYLPLYKSSFENKMPEDIAVGNSSLLATNNDGDCIYLYTFDLNNPNNSTTPVKLEHNLKIDHIHDCCYQSGYYYVLYSVDNELHVYKIDERSQEEPTSTRYGSLIANPVFTVDVFGKPHVYSKSNGYLKLDSDLTGCVFALKTDGFYKLVEDEFKLQFNAPDGVTLKSFTLDIDKKDVYFIAEDYEFLYKTSHINNSAINETLAPENYKITDTNAIENRLTAYTVNSSSNVYSISESERMFYFNNLTNHEEYYLFVCELNDLNHKVLIGQKGLVLVHNDNLTEHTLPQEEINKIKYISTSVCAYYFPIIDENSSFALTNNGSIELTKGQEITAKYSVEILSKKFYFATFMLDGQEVSGYIPADFTVDELAVDLDWTTFTIETSKGVNVFSDASLKNKVTTLEKGTTVRLYSTKDGVCKIAYFDGQNWIDAYIAENSIEQKPNTTIRNLLIILALTACVCGSITFFVIRKKQD